MYEYYVDILGMRGQLEDQKKKAELAEFVAPEEYMKNPYLPLVCVQGYASVCAPRWLPQSLGCVVSMP